METSITEKRKQRVELKKQQDFEEHQIDINDLRFPFKILIGEQDISPEELKVENPETSEDIFNDLLEKLSKLESALKYIRDIQGISQILSASYYLII